MEDSMCVEKYGIESTGCLVISKNVNERQKATLSHIQQMTTLQKSSRIGENFESWELL